MVKSSQAGSSTVGRATPAATADEPVILHVVRRFLQALGEKDYDIARQQLADTVYFACPPSSRDLTPNTAEALVAEVERAYAPFSSVRHVLSDHIVTTQGDRARCHVTVVATPVVRDADQGAVCGLCTLAGRHRYDLVRTGERWRISACTLDRVG